MANGVQNFPCQKVHERNAFWNKGRLVLAVFGLFGKGVKREKGIEKAKICTDGAFCAIISTFFALFLAFLSMPFFKKSTPYKNLALTFESQKSVFFSYSALTFFCSAV